MVLNIEVPYIEVFPIGNISASGETCITVASYTVLFTGIVNMYSGRMAHGYSSSLHLAVTVYM